ncbi:MAG: DUF5011 domain-containing protein, partial [Magnetococcus sp. WYHC-3]
IEVVAETSPSFPVMRIERKNDLAALRYYGAELYSNDTGTADNGQGIAFIFSNNDSTGVRTVAGSFAGGLANVLNGSEAGALYFAPAWLGADPSGRTDMVLTATGASSGSSILSIESDVGIGSSTPWGALSITNTGTIPSFVVEDSTSPDVTPFIIDATGYVGIGTSTPSTRLVVQDATNPYLTFANGDTTLTANQDFGGLQFFSDDTDSKGVVAKIIASPRGASSGLGTLRFYGGSLASSLTERMSIITSSLTNMDGNVGISSSTPFAQLSVNATDVGKPVLALYGYANQTEPLMLVASTTGSATTTAFIIDNNGKVGIGTSTPWRALSLTGTASMAGLTSSTGAGSICLSASNEIVYNAGTDACLSSLRDTKHDITELSIDSLSIMRSINPVSFIYNEGDGRTRYGFIAEDVAEINPQLATYNANGELSGIDDRALLAVAFDSLKEMDLKLSEIESKIASSSGGMLNPDEQNIVQIVISFFENLGVKLSQGLAEFKKVVVETFTVGSATQPAGITLFDEDTKEPYCLKVKGGEFMKTKGECVKSDLGDEDVSTSTPPVLTTPTITLIGNNPAEIPLDSSYVDVGATAVDSLGNPLMPDITENTVDTSRVGEYIVVWEAHDSALNYASTTRNVIVFDPNAPDDNATTTPEIIPEEIPETATSTNNI